MAGVFGGDPGRRHRCLAHRVGAGARAGRHGRGLPARLPARDPGGVGRSALDCRGLGRGRSLLLGSALVILSNLCFAVLAAHGQASMPGLATVISLDNFAQGVHGPDMIAFMSSLTSASYTATQYAVLSSLYALPPKLLMGTSGLVVDAVGYPQFFVYTASLSIPALLLLYLLARRRDFI